MKRLLLILFCILIGLKSSMASTNKISDEKLMELLEQANEFEAQNNFESAISIYNEALKIASIPKKALGTKSIEMNFSTYLRT